MFARVVGTVLVGALLPSVGVAQKRVILVRSSEKVAARPASATDADSARRGAALSPRLTPPRIAPAAPRWISLVSMLSSRFDSNVNRDTLPVTSVGMSTGLGLRMQLGGRRPWLESEYDAAIHRYTATDRFDRISQRLRLATALRLSRRLELGLVTEGTLKGSSEDRDVSDQLSLLPRLDVRLGDVRRLRIVGGQRWRRFPSSPDQNAINRYVAVELRHRSADGATWEGEGRVERNAAAGPRFDHQRLTFGSSYTTPVWRAQSFNVGMQYRVQRYPGRLVELDDVDFPRRDYRFEPSAGWQWQLGTTVLDVRYEPEHRGSNDPSKNYVQHMWTMGLSRRW